MRWKLLLVASLLATLSGAGASLAITYELLGSAGRVATPGLVGLATLLIPLGTITSASVFVYRHTARRRPLQAMATALLATALTLAALTAGSVYLVRRARGPVPAPTPAKDIG